MNQVFTISDFITNRWSEARQELHQLDSAFVKTMEVYNSATDRGLVIPDLPIHPTHGLSTQWVELLEATVDISMELDRLKLTVSKVKSAPNRKEGIYSFDTWVQDIYNLCEKTKRLISSSCSLYSLGKRKDKYRKEVEKNVQTNAGKMRQALVHGADDPKRGGLGINAKAITNERLWEGSVAVGPEILQYLTDSTDALVPNWLGQIETVTENVVGHLGATLHRLEKDMIRTRSNTQPLPCA